MFSTPQISQRMEIAQSIVWLGGGALILFAVLVVAYEHFCPTSEVNQVSARVAATSNVAAYVVRDYNSCTGFLSGNTREECTNKVISKAQEEHKAEPREVKRIIDNLVDQLVKAGFPNAAN